MKKVLFLSSILTVLAQSFYSCKSEGGANPPLQTSFPLPNEIKEFMYFKPGTFWIYKDSATNMVDTVTVTDTVAIPITTNGKYYEQYQTITYSTHYKYYFYYSINTSWSEKCISGNQSRPCYNIKHIMTRPGSFIGENYLVFLPFQKNYWGYASMGIDNAIVRTTDIFDSVSFNPFVFSKVIQVNTSSNLFYGGAETNFYIARNVGLVRKEITPKQGNKIVWLLVDYKIVQ